MISCCLSPLTFVWPVISRIKHFHNITEAKVNDIYIYIYIYISYISNVSNGHTHTGIHERTICNVRYINSTLSSYQHRLCAGRDYSSTHQKSLLFLGHKFLSAEHVHILRPTNLHNNNVLIYGCLWLQRTRLPVKDWDKNYFLLPLCMDIKYN